MKAIKHTLRMALGISLVIIGIIGLILPVMPGWVFLIPGLLILGDYFPPIRRLVEWAKGRFAEANEQFRKARQSNEASKSGDATQADAEPLRPAAPRPEPPGVAPKQQET